MFREALSFTQSETGFNARLIEKDYYCSLLLQDLLATTAPQWVFKGGTWQSQMSFDNEAIEMQCFRIGDDRHVDLLRYVAWLVALRHEPRSQPDGDPYQALKERARARNAVVLAVPPVWTSMPIEVCRGEPPWELGIKNGLRTSQPPG